MNEQKVIQAIGFVVKANEFVYGQRLMEQMAKKRVFLVITCFDMGIAVKKKVNDKANFYQVEIINDVFSVEQLTKLTQHKTSISAIGITDKNLAKLIKQYF